MNQRINDFIKEFMCSNIYMRYAGGAVRDFLLGKEPSDFDLCTPTLPEDVMKIARKLGYRVLETGLSHGTISVILDKDLHVEVTTLRVDQNCDGRHAEVTYTTDWEKDSSRRDFRFNSMMMDHEGNLYDWFDGKSDLEKGLIRFVGDPDKRVKEDYLRILRFFRFANKFENFTYDEDSLLACMKNREGLKQISGERIQSEMFKILAYDNVKMLLSLMWTSKILVEIGMDRFDFYKVQQLSRNNEGEGIYHPNPLAVLAATGSDSKKIIERWKLSNDDAKQLVYLENHAFESLVWYLENFEDDLVNGVPIDWVIQGMMLCDYSYHILKSMVKFSENIPVFPVTGDDLIQRFSMKQGVTLGNTLKNLRAIWMDSRFVLTKEQLLNKITN